MHNDTDAASNPPMSEHVWFVIERFCKAHDQVTAEVHAPTACHNPIPIVVVRDLEERGGGTSPGTQFGVLNGDEVDNAYTAALVKASQYGIDRLPFWDMFE